MKSYSLHLFSVLLLALFTAGCRPPSTQGTLVLTQAPIHPSLPTGADVSLDVRYPEGTRIVALPPGAKPGRARVLSPGLLAAGNPRLSPDGNDILFCGKASPSTTWQIFRVPVRGGSPERLTDQPGGASDPAWLPDGRFAFCSPLPHAIHPRPSVYVQPLAGGPAEQLTHAATAVSELTVLRDGRILYVGELSATADGLFTINSDGTEVTAFAALHDGAAQLRRPRELPDGRIVFLARSADDATTPYHPEQVQLARPFSSRQPLDPPWAGTLRSLEPGIEAPFLAGFLPTEPDATSPSTFAIYASAPPGTVPQLVFDDPSWHDFEAVQCSRRMKPMGRLSTVNRELAFGRLLCLDANFSADPSNPDAAPSATRVRFLGRDPQGLEEILGEAPVQQDGSFLVEVPVNRPLGLETLDAQGRIIHRLPPSFWVRPGENRACIGCHEPHNHAPRNSRPLATKFPPTPIGSPTEIASWTRTP